MRQRTWVLALGVLAAACAAPAATTWSVSTVAQLNNAFTSYSSGDEIVIQPGTYNLSMYLYASTPNVTIRGATGNRDDVILVGGGMNVNAGVREGLSVSADDVTVRDLSFKDFYYHGIHLRAENDADRYVISNVHTIDCGERHIKGSWNSSPSYISQGGLIENVLMEQTKPLTNHNDNDYIGGMDIMATDGLVIRDCQAFNIQGATGGGRGGIFVWNSVTNITVERNQIVGCDRGIAFGNPSGSPYLVDGGVLRNNFITRGAGIGLELCYTRDVDVYNNTLYSADPSYFRTVHIYGTNTNLDSRYNLIRGDILFNAGGTWTATGNIMGAAVAANWFVDPANGELFLTENATAAINAALPLAGVTVDYQGGPRPAGAAPDVGADEFASPMGDANYDGKVDGADYTIWADNYKASGNWGKGDFDLSGFVDGADYTLWADSFGFDGGAAGASVPEPTTLMLLAPAAVALLRARRRR